MPNYTKNQIESGTLSAKELLDSWTSGQGATHSQMTRFDHVKDGAINNIPCSVALLTAVAKLFTVKNKVSSSFYDALKLGYLSINHLDEYKEETKKKIPLVGHYLTAKEYLQSCFDLLPALPIPTFEDIQAELAGFKPSMNKTELVALIESIIALRTPKVYTFGDLTEEQRLKYTDLTVKEEALHSASSILGPYLEDIKPVSDTTIQGKFRPETGTGALLNQLITEEKYSIIVTTPVPAKLDASFNIVETSYILFSIKVV